MRVGRRAWPSPVWNALPDRPHHPIALGVAAAVAGLEPADAVSAAAYLSISGPATAAQRLLAMDPLAVAALTARGETAWFALANAVWCAASLTGGWIYGGARRPPPTAVLLALLALGSLPVALGGPWWTVTLLLIPAGAFCAPALASATETVGRLAPDGARGVAIGLHSSALSAQALGGRIEAHSDGPGLGARFELILPRAGPGEP